MTFAMHYRAISNMVSHLEVFRHKRINTAKQKDALTSFLMLRVLKVKIFQVIFQKRVRVFHQVSNTRKLMKARGRRPSAFIVFECLKPR